MYVKKNLSQLVKHNISVKFQFRVGKCAQDAKKKKKRVGKEENVECHRNDEHTQEPNKQQKLKPRGQQPGPSEERHGVFLKG